MQTASIVGGLLVGAGIFTFKKREKSLQDGFKKEIDEIRISTVAKFIPDRKSMRPDMKNIGVTVRILPKYVDRMKQITPFFDFVIKFDEYYYINPRYVLMISDTEWGFDLTGSNKEILEHNVVATRRYITPHEIAK